MKLTESRALFKKAQKFIPTQTQSLSKGYTQWVHPIYIEKGKGPYVWDVDNNQYLDWGMGLGSVILGHAHSKIAKAIYAQARKGNTYSLCHRLEVDVAEQINKLIPCADMVRFGKNGSDVTSAAVRLARAYTGREHILACGYHGFQDWYIALTERDRGVPKCMKQIVSMFRYNDIESLKEQLDEHNDNIAGIIMEPMAAKFPYHGFLEQCKILAHKKGVPLIFDEVFTAFRWSSGGAQKYFNVTPDIAALGKCMGNGAPISALVGKEKYMQTMEDVFFSFVFGGEATSLAATQACLDIISTGAVNIHINRMGLLLKMKINDLIRKHSLQDTLTIVGHPAKLFMNIKGTKRFNADLIKTFLQQECMKMGVLFIGYHMPCWALKPKDIHDCIMVYNKAFGLLRKYISDGSLRRRVNGPVLKPVFKNVGDRSEGLTK